MPITLAGRGIVVSIEAAVAADSTGDTDTPLIPTDFRRGWISSILMGIFSAPLALIGLSVLARGDSSTALVYFGLSLWGALNAIAGLKGPYVKTEPAGLTVYRYLFFRKFVPIGAIRGALPVSGGKMKVVYGDGDKVVIDLKQIPREERDVLLREIQRLVSGARRLTKASSGRR
jgi:hypothetical protein